MRFSPSLVEIGRVVLEKKILQLVQCIYAISLLSPFEIKRDPLFEQTCIPFNQGCFVPSYAEIGPVVLVKNFIFHQCIFTISLLSHLGKGLGPSFEET